MEDRCSIGGHGHLHTFFFTAHRLLIIYHHHRKIERVRITHSAAEPATVSLLLTACPRLVECDASDCHELTLVGLLMEVFSWPDPPSQGTAPPPLRFVSICFVLLDVDYVAAPLFLLNYRGNG